MTADILTRIVAHKKEVNQRKQEFYQSIRSKLETTGFSRYRVFQKQISRSGQVNIIAEIKKASPSKGLIRADFDPIAIAKIYQDNNVAAISVLTEDKFFLGKPEYLKRISFECPVPLLTKDFIISDGQIYEAKYHGASAVLLIMAILTDAEVKSFMRIADALDLDCLVEVHDADEVKRALDCGADIIGINNRNLRTFEVDLSTCDKLIPLVGSGRVIVAESGIQNFEDICRLQQSGAQAVLIGETLMRAPDIGLKLKEMMGKK